jgi:hypothetical protein
MSGNLPAVVDDFVQVCWVKTLPIAIGTAASLSGLMAWRSERKIRKCSVRVRVTFIGEIYEVLTGRSGRNCVYALVLGNKK